MSDRETRRDRLRSTIDRAKQIETHLADVRARHLGRVHFRPSSAGIAMVGLLPDRPQRGASGIKNLARLAADFDHRFRTRCIDCVADKRPTPEKSLQSHLLADAYRHGRRLRLLALPGEDPPHFVTDEVPFYTPRKRVSDILALHGDHPLVIELKYERAFTELVEQVTTHSACVEADLDLFSELYSVILGRPIELRPPCARMIVWPHLPRHVRDPREDELHGRDIRVAGYVQTGTGFTLHVGRAVTLSR